MRYRLMPKTNDQLSILGFGCMRLPARRGKVDEKKAIQQIRYAIDKGVNYLDTAWPYHGGKSEVILGKALQDGYREKVKIADKLPQWLCKTREDMEGYLDTQLERLGVEVIDYYLVHAVDGASWKRVMACGVIDFLNEAVASGKIRHVGFSFHGPAEDFKQIVDDYDWAFCQIQFNMLDEHFQAGLDGLNYAWSKDIGVIVMEPLRGGSLAGKQPDEVEKIYQAVAPGRSNVDWSLRWIWDHPGVILILSGMNDIAQIDENTHIAATADVNSLSPEERQAVHRAAEAFRGLMEVPCTGCQYCMPCPENVNIPSAFSYFNSKYLFKKGLVNQSMYLLQHAELQGRSPSLASQCVECGTCVPQCPQQIDIPAELKKVQREFEGWTSKPLLALIKAATNLGKRKRA